jgi:hypothetical protein
MEGKGIVKVEDITNRIYTLRGVHVMLDEDLAKLYEVETRALNQAVKRNKDRFPDEFMFQLTQVGAAEDTFLMPLLNKVLLCYLLC